MRNMVQTMVCATTIFAGLVGAIETRAADITGAGATFPYPIYSKWADAYKNESGTGLNYQPIGSGGGIKQIQSKTVTFGASDMPLKGEQLDKDGLVQFPTVMGGVEMAVNLEGISPGQLVLDGATIAKIYLGAIKRWDDVAIKKLNPNAELPSGPIVVVHRSDGSGTTFVFTDYLSKVDADFKAKIGSNTSVSWPVGIGAKGSEGVANNVGQTKGAIGYVEHAYVKQNKLTHANMINQDGKTIASDLKTFQAAAVNANWSSAPGFGIILTNQPGPKSWPITSATFILMHKKPVDASASKEALKFFAWAYDKGGDMAASLDYVPMPKNVVEMIKKEWAQIVGPDGKPLM